MGNEIQPVKISEGIYWVGVVDWNLRDFHGYETPKGGTYNSYLIIDEKITLIDTVKAPFFEEMIGRISQIVDPAKIDYIVSNHVEMDHSSSLPAMMEVAPKAKIFCSAKGKKGLFEHYREMGFENWDLQVVQTGDEISIGKKTLQFIEVVMLHWPDSMHTYLKEDRILFSNDAFGQHIATSERFEDQVEGVMEDAEIYYANILMPFGKQVLVYAEKVKQMGLKFDIIAPAHGVIWRKEPERIIEAYVKWANAEAKQSVLIIYDTMWNSTEIMAKEILYGIESAGVDVKLRNLRKNDWSKIVKELMDASIVAIGSPTLNNGMFFTIAGFLSYMKGLRPKGKKFFVFGSYGWGGGAVKGIEKELTESGFEIVEPGFQVNFKPFEEDRAKCREIGSRLASLAKK